MKTKEEIKQWLLENCVDRAGDLDLSNLDFSDFDGDVDISHMKVKGNLYQNMQKVSGNLDQDYQIVCGYLYQGKQDVRKSLQQCYQNVGGDLYQERQNVGGDLRQDCQKVKRNIYQNDQKIVGNTADKLGQLEDIEEELGIDLITLFKALKNGVCYFTNGTQLAKDYVWMVDNCIALGNRWKLSYSFITAFERQTLSFKDYGKTWALTREELENDK